MIASFISGGEGYLNGARALAVSLIDHEPQIPRLLLVEDNNYSDRQIRSAEAAGWAIRIVEPVRSQPCEYVAPRWVRTFSKLHVWSVDAPLVVYLDADCFALHPFYAAITAHTFETVAACWVAPADKNPRWNSGVFAVRPDPDLAASMIEEVRTGDPAKIKVTHSDQGYLNYRLPKFTRIPDRYNYRWWKELRQLSDSDPAIAHIRPYPWTGTRVNSAHQQVCDSWCRALAAADAKRAPPR